MADLKPPVKGYALWLEAKPHDQEVFQDLADGLAGIYGTCRFLAHATLTPLLDTRASDLDNVRRVCTLLAESYRGVTMELVGVGMRDAYFQSVFMPAVPTADLMRMNLQARQQLGYEIQTPYMPHWSAVYGDLHRWVKQAVVQVLLAQFVFPKIVPLGTIALVDLRDGYPKNWEVIDRFPLA